MDGFGLAYVALVSKDVPVAARVLGELLGLSRGDTAFGAGGRVPVFALGETALALFAPDDPFLGGGARPGVHHVALAADDPRRAAEELRAAGFRTAPAPAPAGEAVALDPTETAGVPLRLHPALGLGDNRSEWADRIDPVGIASADNEAAVGVFCGRLGCPLERRQTDMEVQIAVESFTSDRYGVVYHTRPPVPVGGLRVAFVTTGDCELEFLQNFDPDQAGQVWRGAAGDTRQDQGAIARFVAARGPGLHHIAFKTPDIDRTLARLAQAGLPLIDRKGRPGSRRARIGFVHPDAMGGVLIHAVERS
ncbi:MAG: VOC family protein [Acetobacteraceae bacterium]|nr:VOC family protein [Acetobacteraceae bacterium]